MRKVTKAFSYSFTVSYSSPHPQEGKTCFWTACAEKYLNGLDIAIFILDTRYLDDQIKSLYT